jgi:hypothetical protein
MIGGIFVSPRLATNDGVVVSVSPQFSWAHVATFGPSTLP